MIQLIYFFYDNLRYGNSEQFRASPNRHKISNSEKKSQDLQGQFYIKYRKNFSWHRDCCCYQVKKKLSHLVGHIGESMPFF